MTKRNRYLILALCIIVFFILAPLIIIYAIGYRFNTNAKSFSKTGTIAVKTEPKTTKLSLDGESVGTSPKNIKFVTAGNHILNISQKGYHDWSKNLDIYSGKVTWAYLGVDKVHLILEDQKPTLIAGEVIAVAKTEDSLLYLTKNSAVKNDASGDITTIPLPQTVDQINSSQNGDSALAWSDKTAYLLNFKSNTKTELDIPITKVGFFGQTPIILSNKQLVSLSDIGKTNQIFSTSATDFFILGQALYFFEKKSSGNFDLLVTNFGGKDILPIKTELAGLDSPKLFVTPSKDIVILDQGVVYKISAGLEALAKNITAIDFSEISGQGVLRSDHELYRLNFSGQNQEVITRSSQDISVSTILPEIGYAIFSQGNELMVIELDRRDKQNTYTLSTIGNYKAVWEYKKGFLAVFANNQLWKMSLY